VRESSVRFGQVLRRVVIVLALCALLGVACSKSSRGYSGDTEGAFMESCTVNQGQPAPVCKCTYDEITRQIPFDRYVELDKQLQADPNKVPEDLIRIVSDCGSRANTTTTVTTTTSSSSSSSASSSASSSTSSSSTDSSSSSTSSSSSGSSSSP
jgi:hypothetical protein